MSIWGKAKHFLIYVKYMIPSLFDLSVYSICSIISGIMTSKWIGTTAMGAVSVASPYISFIYAYGLIFGVGGSTVISIHRGRGDESTAKEVFSLNIACMTATTILISLAAFVFTKQLASLLGATPENTKYVVQYLRIITLFSLPYGFSYMLGMMLKADGHPLVGLIGSTAATATNLILLFVLTEAIHMGIAGVAMASAMSQVVLSLVYLGHFLSKRSSLKFVPFLFRWKKVWHIIQLGVPDALSEGSPGIFAMAFNYLVYRNMGETGIVVFSVINYISLLTTQMLLGATQGMSPLVSFYKGKQDLVLEKLYHRFAQYVAIAISALVFAVCMLKTDWVVAQFISPNEMEAYQAGLRALRIFSWFLPFAGFTIVSIGYLSAIQRPQYSQFLSLFRGLIGVVAFGIVLSRLWGEIGIWLAPVASEGVAFLIALWMLSSEKRIQIHRLRSN